MAGIAVLFAMLAGLLLVSAALLFGSLLAVDRATAGLRYFGATRAEREATRQRIRRHGAWILPIARVFGGVLRCKRLPSVSYRGVSVPGPVSSVRRLSESACFEPSSRDVFVVTAPKCGTTWMQQIVYEVLSRGAGNLGDDGHRHIQAVSPWLESTLGTPLECAPAIGERKLRIIKTHLPASLCPYSTRARYIYVTRNPVAAFASLCDFSRKLLGPLAPEPAALVDWYCSERAWFRPWPEHVRGWWTMHEQHRNVAFLHYEQMLADLPAAVSAVSRVLDVELSREERAVVVAKSRGDYMRGHQHLFEMAPPGLFSEIDGAPGFFVSSGRRVRTVDVGVDQRRRILEYCRAELAESPYPVELFYPELRAKRLWRVG